ncbi:hypothetical protein [Cylindrospermopsis raciborskii]|nr:hypothetical protein [Cylindrospermopsis raciborskii]
MKCQIPPDRPLLCPRPGKLLPGDRNYRSPLSPSNLLTWRQF